MTLYRFTNQRYAKDLSGTGAKLFGGRWNHKGLAGLYTSSSISLALLEVIVNALSLENLESLSLLTLEIPQAVEDSFLPLNKLKDDWDEDLDYTKFIGSEFLQKGSQLMLRCPSAVVNEEYNYLLNPLHTEYKKVQINSVHKYRFDKRLFKEKSN